MQGISPTSNNMHLRKIVSVFCSLVNKYSKPFTKIRNFFDPLTKFETFHLKYGSVLSALRAHSAHCTDHEYSWAVWPRSPKLNFIKLNPPLVFIWKYVFNFFLTTLNPPWISFDIFSTHPILIKKPPRTQPVKSATVHVEDVRGK